MGRQGPEGRSIARRRPFGEPNSAALAFPGLDQFVTRAGNALVTPIEPAPEHYINDVASAAATTAADTSVFIEGLPIFCGRKTTAERDPTSLS